MELHTALPRPSNFSILAFVRSGLALTALLVQLARILPIPFHTVLLQVIIHQGRVIRLVVLSLAVCVPAVHLPIAVTLAILVMQES